MAKNIWECKGLIIEYKNGIIIPYKEVLINNIGNTLDFFYTIEVKGNNKTLFKTKVKNYSKVDKLGSFIESILNIQEDEMLLYNQFEEEGCIHSIYYTFLECIDPYDSDIEYFYKIEKNIEIIFNKKTKSDRKSVV